MIDGRPLLILVAAAVLGSLGLSPQVAQASHNPPVATFAIDVSISGNAYSGSASDNRLVVGAVDSCVQVNSTGAHTIDIVGQKMRDVTAYDIRLVYNPAHVAITASRHTPFSGGTVGFLNLPYDAPTFTRRAVSAVDSIDNANGTAFLVATYNGSRTAFFSPDEPHPATGAEPYTAGPGGVPLVRLTVSLKAAAAGKVVTFDLTNSVTPRNDYVSFKSGQPFPEEIIIVPNSNLIDGAVAVAPATCPGAGAPTPTPAPTPPPSDGSPPESTQPPTGQTATPPTPAPATPTPTAITPTPIDGGAGGGTLTEEQIEELTAETTEGLIEEARADQTSLVAVLDAVTAGGSTDLLALCADENSKPLPDVDITFKIDQEPGSASNLDGQAEVTKTSDAEGVAEATLNVGNSSGEIVVSATAEECDTETITVTVLPPTGSPGPAGGAASDDDDGGSGGSPWQIAVYAAAGAVALAAASGLIWRWRRRSR